MLPASLTFSLWPPEPLSDPAMLNVQTQLLQPAVSVRHSSTSRILAASTQNADPL